MGIAAAIISGVVGAASAAVSAAGASSSAKAQEDAEAKRLSKEEEENEKMRKERERQQRQDGLGILAQGRQSAMATSRQRTFGKDVKSALKGVQRGASASRGVPQLSAPQAPPQIPSSPQMPASPPMPLGQPKPLTPVTGLPTSTIGRR